MLQVYNEKKTSFKSVNQSLQSYLGYLSHSNAYKLSTTLKNQVFLICSPPNDLSSDDII